MYRFFFYPTPCLETGRLSNLSSAPTNKTAGKTFFFPSSSPTDRPPTAPQSREGGPCPSLYLTSLVPSTPMRCSVCCGDVHSKPKIYFTQTPPCTPHTHAQITRSNIKQTKNNTHLFISISTHGTKENITTWVAMGVLSRWCCGSIQGRWAKETPSSMRVAGRTA